MGHVDPWIAKRFLANFSQRGREWVGGGKGESRMAGREWQWGGQLQDQFPHPLGPLFFQILRGPGKAHQADGVARVTPRQTSPIEEAITIDSSGSTRQLHGPLELILDVPVNVLGILGVVEEAISSGWGHHRPDDLPVVLVQWEGFGFEVVPIRKDFRSLTNAAQVEVECLAYRVREIVMVQGQMQDEPDHFAPDQTLLS